MTAIALSPTTLNANLFRILESAGALSTRDETLNIQIPADFFISTGALAFLAAWGMRERRSGREIRFFGKSSDLRYLSRIDLFKHLEFRFEETFERHPEEGRFIPIRLIDGEASVGSACHAICELALAQFDNAREFLPAMEWAVYEIIDNVRLHSSSQSPGAVLAQFYPNRHRLDIAVCDVGRGIYASLSESRKLWSHGDAITKALMRGVTRNPEVGQGNGLAGSLEIAKANLGGFQVWSGNASFRVIGGRESGFENIPDVPGTGVFFQLDTSRPVDLRDTFITRIAEADWSYLNYAAEKVQERGAIRIVDECANTGSREAATPLRRRIQALLPDVAGPITLDFSGIEMTSSSFLDELLGRLAAFLGGDEFHRRILVVCAPELVAQMAAVVIRQRLMGLEGVNS